MTSLFLLFPAVPGPTFCTGDSHWKVRCAEECNVATCENCKKDKVPSLASFVCGYTCFMLFEVFDFNHDDAEFLQISPITNLIFATCSHTRAASPC